jgi:hypothetical protein
MLVNSSVTIYHKGFDNETRLEKWERYNYDKVWFFSSNMSIINKGYTDSNSVQVRISYDMNDVNIENFSVGDIIVQGTLTTDITTQEDLSNYQTFNITNITNNTYGKNKHIHLQGK